MNNGLNLKKNERTNTQPKGEESYSGCAETIAVGSIGRFSLTRVFLIKILMGILGKKT